MQSVSSRPSIRGTISTGTGTRETVKSPPNISRLVSISEEDNPRGSSVGIDAIDDTRDNAVVDSISPSTL